VVTLKRFLSALVVVGVLMPVMHASVALGVPREIAADDNFFSPDAPPVRNLAIGPSFHWQRAPGAIRRHNVRQDTMLFYSGAATTTLNYSISASAGSYHYYCELHYSTVNQVGMDGVLKVKPIGNPNPAGNPFTVSWALSGTNTGTRFDVRYRRGTTGVFTNWKVDSLSRSGVFGQGGAPVAVAPGQTYQFQARSQKAPSQQSGWSPVLTFRT
jgi:hypothetical protein